MMSENGAEVVRQSYEAFNERGLAGATEYWHPEIVWHTDPSVPEPGVYTGFDEVRTYLEGFIRAFGAWEIDLQEIIDLGGGRVLSMMTVAGSPLGQSSQKTHFLDWAWIVSVRGGKIAIVRSFLDKQNALDAAGISR